MEILADELSWAQNDAEKWDAFLRTETGKRLIPKLVEHAPTLLSTGDTNSILIRTGEFRGFQQAAQTLLSLTRIAPSEVAPVVNEYPPLEDDKAWNDGRELSPEQKPQPPSDII